TGSARRSSRSRSKTRRPSSTHPEAGGRLTGRPPTTPERETRAMTDTKAYEPPTIKRADDSDVEQLLIFSTERPNPDYDPNQASHDGGENMEPANPPTIVTHYTMPNKPNVGLALAYLKM